MTEYALYRGDELLGIGTAKELAKERNVKESTIKWYATKSAHNRYKTQGLIAIKLEEEN